MAGRKSLQYRLVRLLNISHKAANALINEGKVLVNNLPPAAGIAIESCDEIRLNGEVIQKPAVFNYLVYNKPPGVECTFNAEIKNNLKEHVQLEKGLYNVGRLDKESEGLLLFTNNPKFYDLVTESNYKLEKEYYVEVDKIITEDFLTQLRDGVVIMGQRTLPAKTVKISDNSFSIVLIQGLNRQIRRMCYKQGYEVTRLVRTRIGEIYLKNLKPGEQRDFNANEIAYVKNILTSPQFPFDSAQGAIGSSY